MNLVNTKSPHTTPELERVNLQLAQLLSNQDPENPDNYEQFTHLTETRDKLVKKRLSELQEPQLSEFAKAEYQLNQEFVNMAQSLLSSVKDDLVQFIRGRKAVNRYK